MICAHCSAEMPDISSYCPGCGESVHTGSEVFTAKTFIDGLLSALAYIAFLPAIVLLLVPATRRNAFIRFHAWQGLLFSALTVALGLVLRLIFLIFPILGSAGFLLAWLLLGVSAIAFTIAWLTLMIKAILGQSYELPYLGPLAAHLGREDR